MLITVKLDEGSYSVCIQTSSATYPYHPRRGREKNIADAVRYEMQLWRVDPSSANVEIQGAPEGVDLAKLASELGGLPVMHVSKTPAG